MKSFSLINVHETDGDHVVGTWIQDCIGTKQDVVTKAKRTEVANGNKITVSVTERVDFGLLDGPGRAKRV